MKEQLINVIISHREVKDIDGDDGEDDDVQPVFFVKQEDEEEEDVMCEPDVAGNSNLPVDPIVVAEESCSGEGALFEEYWYPHLPPPAVHGASQVSWSQFYTFPVSDNLVDLCENR